MDFGLAEKAVIVTGAGSNIGRGIALGFGKEKANVILAELDEAQGNKVAGQVKAAGAPKAIQVTTDVTKWDSVQAMVKRTLEELGKIDVLVNNVGWTMDRLFMEKSREEWQREIDINLWSVINCIRAVLDPMTQQKSGVIVSIGSDAGRLGEWREAVYGACKGGVIALSKALTRELTPRTGVRFNVVCPGVTLPADFKEDVGELSLWTEESLKEFGFTPDIFNKMKKSYFDRRLGTPEDIANAALFLASDVSSHICGQTLSVSGGYTMM